MSKICRNCGTVMDDAAVFCNACGRRADNAAGANQQYSQQQNNPYGGYGQNPYGSMYNQTPFFQQETEKPETLGKCLLTMVIMCIPIVGFIYMIIIACNGSEHNKTTVNWVRAGLVLAAICFVIGFLFALIAGPDIAAEIVDQFSEYPAYNA